MQFKMMFPDRLYAHHALGGVLKKSGREAEALEHYIAAAEQGRMECAYNAYVLLKKNKRAGETVAMPVAGGSAWPSSRSARSSIRHAAWKKGVRKDIPGANTIFVPGA